LYSDYIGRDLWNNGFPILVHVGSATVISHSTPYDSMSIETSGSSVFKTKSLIGLNVPSEVAKQLLYLSEVIPLIEYVVRMACPSYIF
jgi:hypothetical protein